LASNAGGVDAVKIDARVNWVIIGNGILRVAGGASSVLVGTYIADLNGRGVPLGAGLAGGLAATSFGAELAGSIPFGMLSDVVSVRALMVSGALLAAVGTLLFPLTRAVPIFVLSRILEGLAVAISVPAMLAYLTEATASNPLRRTRSMSYFELSLLAGLALGGVTAAQAWNQLGVGAFLALSLMYVAAAGLLFRAHSTRRVDADHHAWRTLHSALALPDVRRLAPVWLCMNAIVGLWLGPTFYFLMTHRASTDQWLDGLFAGHVQRLGWLLLAYAAVFSAGVVIWSRVLPSMNLRRALGISLVAMLGVCVTLTLLNHLSGASATIRWMVIAVTAVLIMVESGFTPAALSLLATAVAPATGRGVTMGVYSFLLSLGALVGSVIAGLVGGRFAVDGLIAATAACAVLALVLSRRLEPTHAV